MQVVSGHFSARFKVVFAAEEEPSLLGRLRCGRDDIGWRPPGQDVTDALTRQARHARPRSDCCTPDVRKEGCTRCAEHPVTHSWFPVVDVESGGVDGSRLKRVDECVFVHDGSTCRVDQDRRRLHAIELCCPDQMPRRLVQRNMQADDVRSLQELVECRDETGKARVVARCVHHLHVESGRPLGHGTGDATETDESERRPVYVTGQMRAETPPRPPALLEGLARHRWQAGLQSGSEGRRGLPSCHRAHRGCCRP